MHRIARAPLLAGCIFVQLLLTPGCQSGTPVSDVPDAGPGGPDAAMRPDGGAGLVCPQALGDRTEMWQGVDHRVLDDDDDDDDADDDDDDKYLMPDPRCQAGVRWVGREHESELMHPGADCIDCHRRSHEAPSFSLAGTIYAAAAEPTDCLGLEAAVIRITDAAGQRIELVSNRAGNFFRKLKSGRIALPYTAEVSYKGRTRRMYSAQCETSCNACHTAEGLNGAPGRILAP